MPVLVTLRFYEELNDFLPPLKRKKSYSVSVNGNPSIKDVIESQGIPHTEIDLVLRNGEPVSFGEKVNHGDHYSVYPVFESIDISSLKPGSEPLRDPSFILDVHLGKLAKYMRLYGFDTFYRNDLDDDEIIHISLSEKRIILTRDKGILKNGAVTHGYFVRSQNPQEQFAEVLNRFDLRGKLRIFTRCTICNGTIENIDKDLIRDNLEPLTKKYYNEFFRCTGCGKIYWKGSHYNRIICTLSKLLDK